MTDQTNSPQDELMLELFHQEIEANYDTLIQELLRLETHGFDEQVVDGLMRTCHNVKSASKMVECVAVTRLAHELEQSLLVVREKKICNRQLIDMMLYVVDKMNLIGMGSLSYLQNWHKQNDAELRDIADNLALLGSEQVQKGFIPSDDGSGKAQSMKIRSTRVSDWRLQKIMNLSAELMVAGSLHEKLRERFLVLKNRQFTFVSLVENLRDQLAEVNISTEIRDQMFSIMQNSAEMRETLSDYLLEYESVENRMKTLSERLHSEILATRMRPFEDISHGLHRLVRDVANSLGKKVEFFVYGANMLVDREILQKIDTPLKHLIQNAIDHGLEKPAERLLSKKPEDGKLQIRLQSTTSKLKIFVEDDGRGIDFEQVRERAGIEAGSEISEEQLLYCLFQVGFSTKKYVDEISGRGVGLDGVYEAVNELSGNINIQTKKGSGTTFTLIIPIQQNMNRFLLFSLGGNLFALENSQVLEIIELKADTLARSQQPRDEQGVEVPLFELSETLQVTKVNARCGLVVLVSVQNRTLGFYIEQNHGVQALSVKPLEQIIGPTANLAYCAILPDGEIVLTLDLDNLFHAQAVNLTQIRSS